MPFTTKFKTDYIELFDGFIYKFHDESTIEIREPFKNALDLIINAEIDDNFNREEILDSVDPKVKDNIDALLDCLCEPELYGVSEQDYDEFRALLKNRAKIAVDYLESSSDEVLKQFIDEKQENLARARKTSKQLGAHQNPHDLYLESLKALDAALDDLLLEKDLQDVARLARGAIVDLANNGEYKQCSLLCNSLARLLEKRTLEQVDEYVQSLIDSPAIKSLAVEKIATYIEAVIDITVGILIILAAAAIITLSWLAVAGVFGFLLPIIAAVLASEIGMIASMLIAPPTIKRGIESFEISKEKDQQLYNFFKVADIVKENPLEVDEDVKSVISL